MNKTVILRADGNSKTGLGHLYRLFALAEVLKKHFEIIFVTRDDSNLSVFPKEFNIQSLPSHYSRQEEIDWLLNRYNSDENTSLVLDGYQFDSAYQKKLKEIGFRLYFIDDFAKEHMYADVVINHAASITQEMYSKESYTQLALGTKYALLRPSFLKAAGISRNILNTKIAFVSFGGADPLDLTYKVVKALLEIGLSKKVHVVLGAAYKHSKLFELDKMNSHVIIHRNLSELAMYNLMSESDFAIVPASTMLYEVCAVKLPVLSGYYIDNQKLIYNGLSTKGALYPAGDLRELSSEDWMEIIRDFILKSDFQLQLEAQAKLFDSQIGKRILLLFAGIHLREADSKDMMLLYDWANDPVTRANSYDSQPIELESHRKWFESKINNPNTIIYIASMDVSPVGMVRFDIKEEHTVIGVLVDKNYRGMRLASRLLKEATQDYFLKHHKPVWAYIKKTNIASVKAFESAGYQYLKEEIVNEFESFVYLCNHCL